MKLNYRVFCTMILSAMLLCGMVAEARVISGTVKDPTGETIISASVVVQGTTIGTVTDFDGNYTLEVPDDAKVLVFSYIGMQTQELAITGDVLNVVLSENNEVLEEVVVTGYGTTKKRDLVTSVASVGADQIKDIPVTSAAEALQGKLAGVSVTTSDGSPDADVKIRVRGGTSLTQSNDPLYIVDGFPVSSIADIAPGDIASMDVLKDAAATAIYGAQGANGVIIITTKEINTSDADKMVFHADYTGYMGWKQVASKYKMMDVRNFIILQREWQEINKKDNADSYFFQYFDPNYTTTPTTDISALLDYWENREIDWQDRTFGLRGLNSNHSFSVSGGNKLANFNLSYNRIDDESILYGSDYDRNNISFKSKFQPVKGLTLSVTARYTNMKVIGSGMNTADDAGSKSESRVANAVQYFPMELPDEVLNTLEMDGDETSFGSLYDPIRTINHNYKVKTDNKWTLSGYVQYKFKKHFTLKADLGYESHDVKQDRYYGPTTYYSRSTVSAYTDAGKGNVVCTDNKSSRLKHTGSFDWKQSFSNHSLELFAAEEVVIRKAELRTIKGYGYDTKLTGKTVFNHLGAADAYVANTYVNPNDNLLSFIGRFDYNYAGRYYATLTFRADASTKFSKKNQWGYFPSAAIAWRIIDEEWMAPAQQVMSNFKLRLTYGLVGNNNIDLGYINPDYLVYAAANSGLFPTQYYIGGDKLIAANENLKWETTTSRNLGLDFGFWNERLSGSLDVYCNSTRDLLLLYRLPDGGYNYQYRNIGSTRNIGAELSLTGVILDHKSKDLSYGLTLTANIAHNNTKVTSLGGMDAYYVSAGCFSAGYSTADYEYKLVKGGKVGNIYGYKVEGFYTADDFTALDKNGKWYVDDVNGNHVLLSTPFGNARPGLPKLKDVDGDGKADRVKIGNTQPVINGGFSLAFHIGGNKWGKVDMSTTFAYSVGNQVLNLSALQFSTVTEKLRMRNILSGYENRYTYLDDTYNMIRPTGATQKISGTDFYVPTAFADYQDRLNERNQGAKSANPISDEFALTDKYVEDASFLRMSSLNIGYTLPNSVLKKAHMTTMRIFFTASNLFCVTKYSGADPEVDTRSKDNPVATNVDFSAFPKSRAFNFGLTVGF